MNWRFVGPLIFGALSFAVASGIKLIAFRNFTFYIDLFPDLALSATGILFSFAVSEQALFGARTTNQVRRAETGTGVIMEFGVSLPDQIEFNPRFIYLFMICMAVWILTLLCAGQAQALQKESAYAASGAFIMLSAAMAGTTVGIAVRSLRQVG